MRLIDADIFKNAVPIFEKRMDYKGKAKFITSVIAMIDAQPTIEARNVIHGKWVERNQKDFNWYCSVCGYGLTDNRTHYCYDCGAKMNL